MHWSSLICGKLFASSLAPDLRSRYPWSMPPRILSFVIMAAIIGFASPASAKDKEKKKPAKEQSARSWKMMVDYVLKNGGEDSIKAPSAHTLGYDSDEVFAKSLGLDSDKSKDGRDHSIFIIYTKDEKGTVIPKEIVLGNILVKEANSIKEIDSYRIRMTLNGTLIKGMRATGIVGEVVHQSLGPDSKELKSWHKQESDFHLKIVDLAKMTP